MLNRNRTLHWTVEWVHPDGNKTLDKMWETQPISTAYNDHLRHLDTSRPKKRRKPNDRRTHLVTSATFVSASVPVHETTAVEQPNGSTTTAPVGKRQREEDEASVDRNAEGEDPNIAGPGDPGSVQHLASIPVSSDATPATDAAPNTDLTFHLHHPSLPSRHPVLIPLPPDAKLATALANRLVLEFPTIYALRSQPEGRLPDGFVSEEEFFASAKKEVVDESYVGEVGGSCEEGKEHGLEDGEVNEGRLAEVLGKDLRGIAGSL